MEKRPHPLVRVTDSSRAPQVTFNHPLNPDSEVTLRMLSRAAGLERVGVTLGRLGAGKESFIYHTHQFEEEWIFIISGQGVAVIEGEEYEVHPGDFMGFGTPSVAHTLVNPFDEDMIYLMGGERRPCEVATFPELDKLLLRRGDDAHIVDLSALHPMIPEKK